MSYEQFLYMSSLLRYKRQAKEELINFTVRLFDPNLAGFTPNSTFEAMMDLMFEVEDGEGEKEAAKKDAPKKKVEIRTPEEESAESRLSKPASQTGDGEKDPEGS